MRARKTRVDRVKTKLRPLYEIFSSGSRIKINTYKISQLPPNRLITFKDDVNDIWEGYKNN
jgi:hypothetical protein